VKRTPISFSPSGH